jgi:membrane-associated PAP2 superfamily phosphatase
MAVSSLAHLPEPVLEQLLGGMLLTHFRSAHSEQGDLYLLRHHDLPIGQNFLVRADWVIYDRVRRRPVGVFELVRTMNHFRTKRPLLLQLREAATKQLAPMRVGLVVPDSLAAELKTWAGTTGLELVTYPA